MLRIEKLSFAYENEYKTILKEIELQIAPKERVVIVGGSGSGKTTILRLLAGLVAPTKGRILFDETVVSMEHQIVVPPSQRDVSMVFQDLALWPHMNVEENIGFGLKIKGISRKKRVEEVNRFLSLVGLEGYNKKSVDALSGGQQQRVALARALISSPKVVLMDEPLSSLDEALNIRLRAEIIALQEKLGFTLVYVTHNKEEANAIAHRIIKMRDGKIIENRKQGRDVS